MSPPILKLELELREEVRDILEDLREEGASDAQPTITTTSKADTRNFINILRLK
jgi:hypothetical protein